MLAWYRHFHWRGQNTFMEPNKPFFLVKWCGTKPGKRLCVYLTLSTIFIFHLGIVPTLSYVLSFIVVIWIVCSKQTKRSVLSVNGINFALFLRCCNWILELFQQYGIVVFYFVPLMYSRDGNNLAHTIPHCYW